MRPCKRTRSAHTPPPRATTRAVPPRSGTREPYFSAPPLHTLITYYRPAPQADTPPLSSSGAGLRAANTNGIVRSPARSRAEKIPGLVSPSAFLRRLRRDTDIETDLTTGRGCDRPYYARDGPRLWQPGPSDRDDDNGVDTPSPRRWAQISRRLIVPRAPAARAVAAAAEEQEVACGSGVRADYGGGDGDDVRSFGEVLRRVEASARAVSREKEEAIEVFF